MKQILGNVLKRFLGSKVNTDIIEKVAGVLDEYKFTAEEVEKAELDYEANLTERLKADMASDNWLAKAIRPLGFAIWTILLVFIIVSDGNIYGFNIRPTYLPLIESVYITYLGFYVGSRGMEKAIRMWKNDNK